jgi:pimeloyl-ACP methyl ester carboxylesterase
MAAWRFWLLFLAEIVAVGGAVLAAGASWVGALATALAWLVAIRVIVLAAFFVLSRRHRPAGGPEARLGPGAWLRLVLAETVATLAAFFYLHPVAELFNRDPPPGAPGTPVLLVHGFLSNAGFWRPIRRFLARSGRHNHYAVTLGPPLVSLEELVLRLAEQIERVHARVRTPLVLVAHSMGGLVARACLDRPEVRAKVGRLITLGSPHHGTVAAGFMFGTNVRQMRPGSPWLRRYAVSLEAGQPVPTLAVYGLHDNIVMPQDSGVLPHARVLALPALGHMAMAYDGRIRKLLVEELADARVPER